MGDTPCNKMIHHQKKHAEACFFLGDPDENRTRVTAVKGPCLNLLTTGPSLMQKHQVKEKGGKIRLW